MFGRMGRERIVLAGFGGVAKSKTHGNFFGPWT